MPATNRATGRPVPQKGDQTAVQAQALEAKKAIDAAEAAEARAGSDQAAARKFAIAFLNREPLGDVRVTVDLGSWTGRPVRVVVSPEPEN